MKVDNTMLSAFERCPLYYRERHILDWTSRGTSGALGAGGAIHEGLKVWYQNMKDAGGAATGLVGAVNAIRESWPEDMPTNDFRTLERAQRMMIEYIRTYPSESFRILQVEIPFKFELGRVILWCKNCNFENTPYGALGIPRFGCSYCGKDLEQIEYGGIFDTLTEFGVGRTVNYILEHKTTSQLGPTYFRQWQIHNQLVGYCWGAEQVSGKLVGGVNMNVLCMTTGGNFKFDRQMIPVYPSQIEEWKNDVAQACNDIAHAQRTGHWRKRTDNCVMKYGACQFLSVHMLADPEDRQRRLETDYIKSEWNFERRDEEVTSE